MMLSQNNKMKKATLRTFDFALPAIGTCIGAGKCKEYCYATKAFYRMPNVISKHESNYQASLTDTFFTDMYCEILVVKPEAIRIHSSGDFYSLDYLKKWINLAKCNNDIVFYCYTKSVPLFIGIKLPENFKAVFSYGGKYDALIREHNLRSCDLVNYYTGNCDSSDDDDSMIIFSNKNIELIRR